MSASLTSQLEDDWLTLRWWSKDAPLRIKYHFKNDGHWTPEAHQIAAKALETKIITNWSVKE